MMKKLLYSAFVLIVGFASCSKDSEEDIQEQSYSTIIGNTYVTKSERASDSRPLYLIYEFKSNGEITIEERLDSENGTLYGSPVGYYEYNHPSIELQIQSIEGCDDCFNNFTATVSNDRKSFSYQVWDTSTSSHRKVTFKIKQK